EINCMTSGDTPPESPPIDYVRGKAECLLEPAYIVIKFESAFPRDPIGLAVHTPPPRFWNHVLYGATPGVGQDFCESTGSGCHDLPSGSTSDGYYKLEFHMEDGG